MDNIGVIGHMVWDKSELTHIVEINIHIKVANEAIDVCKKKGKSSSY